MASRIQVVFDCVDPDLLTRFWALALGYRIEDPPAGFDDWRSYWAHVGLPEDELVDSGDSIVDPDGVGPRIWFQVVPEGKVVKNRVHLDIDVSGGRAVPLDVRRQRVLAEADRLVEAGATRLRVLEQEGLDHFGVVMHDPESNEFCLH
ncbi:MAG TPA: VOC family protein [Jiangellaceae bacterium]|nr:VOC family protein [Jiangellaceae bacterium]